MRSDLRKAPLGCLAKTIEYGARDGELQDAVAEELEALVRVGAILDPRRVREDLLEAIGWKLGDQAPELVRPGVRVELRPDGR